MKRTSFILMAFALVMTLTQCKKNEEQPTVNDNVVTITLNLNNNNGSKVNVNPSMGTVDFESGDKIYVGSGGKYVGFLTYNGTNFSGNITNPTENQPLQFYFLGNETPQETLSAGTTEECSVIISDQTEHLPVISCAASYENYVSGITAYSAHLLNKCALVKFNVTTPSNSPICITGMHNKVTLDFTNNALTPSQDGEGVIMLPAGGGENVEKWAILLPQEALEEGEEGSAYSYDGSYWGTRPEIPCISNNGYLIDGINVLIVTDNTIPIGAISGLFTINNEGDQVFFSRGNLQYKASSNIWRFAVNQWDRIGSDNANISQTYDGWIDLFGWGTSGYDHGAECYQPWSTSTINSDYYAYISYTYNLNDQTGQADWGYNAISNGGHMENSWRTPSKSEWNYLLNTRSTASGMRYAKATVNNVKGVILLPDDWINNTYGLINANNSGASFSSNTISASRWVATLENAGAVFLPVAGYRYETSWLNDDTGGYYWSASFSGNKNAINVHFNDNNLYPNNGNSSIDRCCGCSVRLIQDY